MVSLEISGVRMLEGCSRIRSGTCEFCLVGGVDSYLDIESLEWLDLNDRVFRNQKPRNPRGFTPGEACLSGRRA